MTSGERARAARERLARWRLRRREAIANVVTSGVGVLGSLAAALILVVLSVLQGTVWHVVGSAVFGATLILLYTASTLYHSARVAGTRARLRVLDHASIYLLIAGTYTPFMLVGLRGGWGWSLLGVIWALAISGVVFKLFFTGRFRILSTAVYLGMGWLVVIAIVPFIRGLSVGTLIWLAAGGLAYTAGTFFYLNRRISYAHAVWHVFVLAGSTCHAVAVFAQLRSSV